MRESELIRASIRSSNRWGIATAEIDAMLYSGPNMGMARTAAGNISDQATRDQTLAAIALMEATAHTRSLQSVDDRVVAQLEATILFKQAELDSFIQRMWSAEDSEATARQELMRERNKVSRLERDLSLALSKVDREPSSPPPRQEPTVQRGRPDARAPRLSPAARSIMNRPEPDPIGIAEQRRIEAEGGNHG